jgi:hypothetical protein
VVATRAAEIELVEAAANGDGTPFNGTGDEFPDGANTPWNGFVAAGTTRLLGSAGLPGTPPPLLLVPSRAEDRTALGLWHGSSRYPAINRPPTPLRTW